MDLTGSEFGSIISTMARLLVMYRARGGGHFVVPARLPEYGDQGVLDPDNIVEIVVVMKCSFGQVYPPPGIVGRFLAWLTQVDDYGECWQHGAFVSYKYHKVFWFESEDDEPHEDGTESKFAGLTLGVQGLRPQALPILKELKASLKQLVSDSAYGYPGLASLMSFGEPVETKSNELLALRSLLDNIGGRLEKIERNLDGVANQLVEQVMFAASAKRRESPYPRLVILVPDAEECGTQGRIQRVGWDRWMEAWKRLDESVGLHQEFRLRFLCEYNLTEVPCGPDGRGYLVKKPKDWVKKCVSLMQVSVFVEISFISGTRGGCVRASPGQGIGSKLRSFHFAPAQRENHPMLLLFGIRLLGVPCFRGHARCHANFAATKETRADSNHLIVPRPRLYSLLSACSSGVAVDLAGSSWHRVKRGPAPERSAGCCREGHRCCTGGRDRHRGS